MLKTNAFVGMLVCGLALTTMATNTAFASDVISDTTEPSIHQAKPDPRTLIIAANGKLEGNLASYIQGLDFTGNVTLHYSAHTAGFVDGDVSVLTIKLPEEFEYVASAPEFAKVITGKIYVQEIFGDKEADITPDMVETYSDRIVIKTPHQLWVGEGDVQADIQIAYGKLLAQYPSLPIPDAPNGYTFVTQLKYDSAMWDVIHDPIIGSVDETYTTPETSAIAHK